MKRPPTSSSFHTTDAQETNRRPTAVLGLALVVAMAMAMTGCEETEEDTKADLAYSSFSYSPTDPDVGDQVTITAIIINAGSVASQATTFQYVFEGQTYIGSLAALDTSASTTVTFTIQGTSAGASTISMSLDPGDNVDESNEGNNGISRTITWSNDDAVGDLYITDVTVSDSTLTPGATAQVSFRVYFEASDSDVGNQTVTWRLVRADDESTPLKTGSFTISEDSSYTKTITFEDADGLGSSDYLIQINYGNTVSEDDTSNNEADFSITWSSSG